MDLKGKKVTHAKFGAGKIVRVLGNTVEIAFQGSIRSFLYPDSFEKFVKLEDPADRESMDELLKLSNVKEVEQKQLQLRRIQADAYAKKMRKRSNSQAVFALNETTPEHIWQDGFLFTGNNLSGKSKGQPRIPKNMNINSACLLTAKGTDEPESERTIVGICMVKEDFIGIHCTDGLLPVHPKYFIHWNEEQEKLLFWNYFPVSARLERWGNSDMKYVPIAIIKQILEDMVSLTSGEEQGEKVQDFYYYFCEMNI
ncbi:MAG: hypothetical protein PHG16_06415 [Lachnospiraceae bacterium]|nr:hypothetical protein [Lachnospiraceae bacterium]